MRALITGSDGSAARFIARELTENGAELIPLTRKTCDLRRLDAVAALLDRERPDVIFHLAADADVRRSFDDEGGTFLNNVVGSINVFEGCRRVGIRPKVVNCSTSEVYGQSDRPIDESFPIAPINPYAISKTAQDFFGQMYAASYGFPVATTRAFGYVNPLREDLSLSTFARQIAEIEVGRREFLEHGNLDSVRTFCDARDMARAYVLAAEHEGVFNIGAEVPVSIGGCLRDLVAMARVPIECRVDRARLRPTDVSRIVPNCARFRRLTGWEPTILLRDSLAWLLDSMRERVARVDPA